MGNIKRDYKWLSKILENQNNRSEHFVSLERLVFLYMKKWKKTHKDTLIYQLSISKFNYILYKGGL